MIRYLTDGSWEGLLCAAATATADGTPAAECSLADDTQPDLFGDVMRVPTDSGRAAAFWDGVQAAIGTDPQRWFAQAFLHDREPLGETIVRCLLQAREFGADFEHYHAQPDIHRLRRASRQVGGEAHRLLGLTRFRKLPNRVYYAPLEPDHRVLWCVAEHFRRRLAEQAWLLHDVRRRTAVFWDTECLQPAAVDDGLAAAVRAHGDLPAAELAVDEPDWQRLWRTFFDNIAIPNRANTALQQRWMPRRYWKYLPERPDATRARRRMT